jgi:hypothetical protein
MHAPSAHRRLRTARAALAVALVALAGLLTAFPTPAVISALP